MVCLSGEKTKREEYLDMIRKRAKESPEMSHIIEESVQVELSEDDIRTEKEKQKK